MGTDTQLPAGLTFHLDSDSRTLVARLTSDVGAEPIDEALLLAAIGNHGYGEMRYLPQAGASLVAKYNAGSAATIKIAECVDGTFRIAMASGDLEAGLFLQPPQGGTPVTIGMVMTALADSEIREGILAGVIEEAIATGSADGVVVARGRPCVHGVDGQVESQLPEVRSRTPKVDESGHIDYRDLGQIQVVYPGDALMLRHLPTKGTDGMTLRGKVIPAKPGKAVMYSANLPGTTYDAGDPNLLRAAIAGQPVLVRGGMIVEPIFKIKEVSIASGNIDFDGTVVVEGDVHSGMAVRASGDIEIGGVADMSILEAGGSIVIRGGVIGSLGHKGPESHIRCGGCLSAGYVQQARVEAGDSIFIDDIAMQSELSANNHVQAGPEGRGQIVGGTVQATLSVTAKVIGSQNHVRTRIEIGINPQMQRQLRGIVKDREGKEAQLLEISKLIDLNARNPGRLRPELVGRAKSTADALSADIATLREEEDIITKKAKLSEQSTVTAQQWLYEDVEIQMGKLHYKAVGRRSTCTIGPSSDGLELVLRDG